VNVIGGWYGVSTEPVLDLIRSASQIAEHRDHIVHGWIDLDEKRNCVVFRHQKRRAAQERARIYSAEGIQELNTEMWKWCREFNSRTFDFLSECSVNQQPPPA
jgi:hypothetical protein